MKTSSCVTVTVLFALLICGIRVASAAPHGGDLKPGEAFVLLKVTGDLKYAVFQRFQGEDTFTVHRKSKSQLIRVKAGRYYLKHVAPNHMGIKLKPYPEPSEPLQTVSIREGAATYIGEWKFDEDMAATDIRYDTKLAFDLIDAKLTVRRYRATDYKLMVAEFGKLPFAAPMP